MKEKKLIRGQFSIVDMNLLAAEACREARNFEKLAEEACKPAYRRRQLARLDATMAALEKRKQEAIKFWIKLDDDTESIYQEMLKTP